MAQLLYLFESRSPMHAVMPEDPEQLGSDSADGPWLDDYPTVSLPRVECAVQ